MPPTGSRRRPYPFPAPERSSNTTSPARRWGGQAYTSTEDIGSGIQLNQFVFNTTGVGVFVTTVTGSQPISLVANGATPPTITQNNSGTAGFGSAVLSFAGGAVFGGGGGGSVSVGQGSLPVAGSLDFTGNAAVTLFGPLALPGSGDVMLTGNGRSTVTAQQFSGSANRLIIDFGPGAISLGSSTSGAWTVANGIEIRSGIVSLGGTSLGAATNVLVIKGGAIAGTAVNPIQLNGSDLVTSGNSGMSIQGPITTTAGAPALRITTGNNVTLVNTADYPGPTVIGPADPTAGGSFAPTLTLDSSSSAGTQGRLLSTSSITVNRGSTLALTNATTVNNNRVPAAPLSINGATLSYTPKAGTANSQTFGDLIVTGHGELVVPNNTATGTTSSLQFGTLNRGSFGTIGIVGPVGGGPPSTAVSQVTFASPLAGISDPLGSGPTAGPVIPFICGNSTSTFDTSPSDLYTPDGNGVRALAAAELDAVAAGGPLAPHTNNLLNGSPAALAAGATVRVNSLRAPNSVTLSGGPGSVLQVYSGTLVAHSGMTINVPTLDFGNTTGYLHAGAFIDISSSITGSAGLVVGTGSVSGGIDLHSPNPFTGGLFINGTGQNASALVEFTADNQLGAAGSGITLGGGGLDYFGLTPLTLSRPLTLTAAGGTIKTSGPLTVDLTGSSGPGNLTLSLGTIRLTGIAGFTGGTVVQTTVQFAGDQNFGAGPIYMVGTLQALAAGTFSKTIFPSGKFDTNGFDVTYTGSIQGTNRSFTKVGAGTLTITTPQPLTGSVSLQGGESTLAGNGTLGGVSSASVSAGATLTLDDTAINTPGRLPAEVLLSGEFVVRGNAAGTTETIGTLVGSGTSGVVTLRPAAGASVTLTAAALNPASIILVRGPNLGGTGPNSSQFTCISPPATVNGLIPGVLTDNDAVAGTGSFLARYDPVLGVVPINPTSATSIIQNAAPTNTPTSADVLVANTVTRDAANTVNSLTFTPGSTLTADTPSSSTLTVSSGAIFVRPGGAASITNVAISAPAGILTRVYANSDLTTGTVTSGSGVLKTGAGTLTVNGSLTTAANMQILAGTVNLNADSNVGGVSGVGTLNVAAGTTLTLTGGAALNGTLGGSGNLLRTTAATARQSFGAVNLTGNIETRAGTLSINGPIGPTAGSLLILGDSVLSSVASTFSIGTGASTDRNFVVTASSAAAATIVRTLGVIPISPVSPAVFTGTVTLNRTLQVALDPAFAATPTPPAATFANTVSGSGQIVLSTASLNLSVANSFSGGVNLASTTNVFPVTLGIGDDGALGQGSLSVTVAGYLQASNGPRVVANPVTFAGGTYLGLVGTNSLTIAGTTDLNGGQRRIEDTVPGTVLNLSDVTGSAAGSNLQVNQAGSILYSSHGTVRIAGTGSYSGTTTVVAGTFQVDGTLTTSTSKVTVNSGAALTGSGTINRPTEIAGTILPGTGAGTGAMNFRAALTWDAGSKYAFTYSAVTGLNPGVNYATINSSSTLNLSAVTSTNPVTIVITPVNSPGTSGGPVTYTLGGFSNGGSNGGIVSFNPADFAFAGSFSGTPSVSVDPTQNTLLLTFTPALLAPTTWTGNASGSWNISANWSPTAVPASGPNTQLVFGPSANSAMTNDIPGTLTVNSLTFNTGSPVYSLSGNGLNLVTNGAGGGPQIVTNSANGATIGVALTLTNNLTVIGAGNLALNGAIGGSGSLTMNGSGTVTLGNSANTYGGGTSVLNGTLQVAADASLGTGDVTGAALGTVNFTGTTATTKSFTMNGGTISVASTKMVTFNGGQVAGAFLDGAGTIASNGAQFVNVTATPSVAVLSTSAADRFVHFDNSASLTVAVGVNTTGASTVVNLNAFTNQGLGSVTVGAGSRINVANLQSFGTVTLNPATTAGQITLMTNLGNSPLAFNAGSRTFIGTPATATASPAVTGVDLHGQNLVIAGGLFVNNGFVADSTTMPGSVIVDFGALYKGAGTNFVNVITQNGGKVQAGDSPGSMSFGNFVFGPGGVNNYVFAIDDATGTAGPSPDAQGLVSGWGLVKAIKALNGSTTTSGDFVWTATLSNKLTFALDTLVNPTVVGTDVGGPMANFDPAQSYAWPAVHWDGTYSGPTDGPSLTASTAFDTSGFVNAAAGTFGWILDPAGQTLSLTYTPTGVPEPGTLTLAGVAAFGWATFRRRRQSNGPSATLSA